MRYVMNVLTNVVMLVALGALCVTIATIRRNK